MFGTYTDELEKREELHGVRCSDCNELLGYDDDDDFDVDVIETRDNEYYCDDCADKYDHTCPDCGEVCAEDLVHDGEKKDGVRWMVCPECKKKAAAKERHDRQLYYDRLHFEQNIEFLEALPHPDTFQRRMLQRARRCLNEPCEGYRAVDIDDAEHTSELDEWGMKRNKKKMQKNVDDQHKVR
jgi:hypothetical protein